MLCVACVGEPSNFRGHYIFGFEISAFQPEGTCEVWWLSGALDPIEILTEPLEFNGEAYPRACAFIEVEGRPTPSGSYGHFGQYTRELPVEHVRSATLADRFFDREPVPRSCLPCTPEPL
jgi:hypothetical protein